MDHFLSYRTDSQRLDLFAWCVRLSRFLVGFWAYLNRCTFISFYSISCQGDWLSPRGSLVFEINKPIGKVLFFHHLSKLFLNEFSESEQTKSSSNEFRRLIILSVKKCRLKPVLNRPLFNFIERLLVRPYLSTRTDKGF